MWFDVITIVITLAFVAIVLKKILPGRGVEQITVPQLREIIKEHKDSDQLLLIDVRKPEKYEQFHIHGFRNIPLKYIRKSAKQLDKNKQVIVVCQTGAQGNEAAKRLKNRGFKQIMNVRGGLSTWDPPA